MFNFVPILSANPNGVLATTDGQSIRQRVFQFLFAEGRKVFFCTSREKEVYRQLAAAKRASFCAYPPDFAPVVTVSGAVVFVDDPAVKARVLNENPMIKEIYQSPDNPVFTVFYLDVSLVTTFSFAEGTKTYQ